MDLRTLCPRIADLFHPEFEGEVTPEIAAWLLEHARIPCHCPDVTGFNADLSALETVVNAAQTQLTLDGTPTIVAAEQPEDTRGDKYAQCRTCRHWVTPDAYDGGITECSRCSQCCADAGHALCIRCCEHTEDACGTCTCCGSCCECYVCERCDSRTARAHDFYTCCDQCDNCGCACEEEEESDGSFSIRERGTIHEAKRYQRKAFSCARLAGVEVEYNRCARFDPIRDWAGKWGAGVHSDGSCGWECVSAPASGDLLLRQLDGLFAALDNADATVNESCGIHVHVDARDFRWADMFRLARVYSHVEPLLYLLGGPERVDNTYCKPWRSTLTEALHAKDPKGAFLEALCSTREGLRDCPDKKGEGRYRGLNLRPWLSGRWFKSGPRRDTTVEFRIHKGSLDAERVAKWTRLLVRLIDWTARASDAEVNALPRSAARALGVIAPELKPWIMKQVQNYAQSTPLRRRRVHYAAHAGWCIGRPPPRPLPAIEEKALVA
jgi:hypothetical protein